VKKLYRISIITPSFNQGQFIEQTIQSVLSQEGDFELEYFVIDGGSSDNTLDIIEEYSHRDSRMHYVTEKDNGQADAINKGFRFATGEIVSWINSDDLYLPGAICKALDVFRSQNSISILYGKAHYIDESSKIIGDYKTKPFDKKRLPYDCFICQPTVFMRREVLNRVGLLNSKLQCSLDYEFWMRISRVYDFHFLNEYLACSRMYPENKTLRLRGKVYTENIQLAWKYYGILPVIHWILLYIFEKYRLRKFQRKYASIRKWITSRI